MHTPPPSPPARSPHPALGYPTDARFRPNPATRMPPINSPGGGRTRERSDHPFVVGKRPKPLSPYDRDIRQVHQMIDPLEQSLTAEYQRALKAGAGAISGYTNELAQQLGGYADAARNIYGGAQQAQAAADAALSGALSGGGQSLADALAAKLAQINAPGNTPQQVAAVGTGSGNALLGTGSASLGRLIQEGASAQDYAAKLPGIARQAGLQDIRDITLASNKSLADQMGEVRAQIPELLAKIQSARTQAEATRYKAQVDQHIAQMKIEAAELIASGRVQEGLQVAEQANATRAAIANANNQTRVSVANASNQTRSSIAAANRQSRESIAAANNRARAQRQQAAQQAKTAKQNKPFADMTKGQVVKLRQGMNAMRFGTTDSSGTKHPPLGYQQAINEAVAEGYSRADAIAMANRFYPPTMRGHGRRGGNSSGLGALSLLTGGRVGGGELP